MRANWHDHLVRVVAGNLDGFVDGGQRLLVAFHAARALARSLQRTEPFLHLPPWPDGPGRYRSTASMFAGLGQHADQAIVERQGFARVEVEVFQAAAEEALGVVELAMAFGKHGQEVDGLPFEVLASFDAFEPLFCKLLAQLGVLAHHGEHGPALDSSGGGVGLVLARVASFARRDFVEQPEQLLQASTPSSRV